MNPRARSLAMATGLVLLLIKTPCWGQLVNPVVSDHVRNTAGGTGALANISSSGSLAFCQATVGCFNTAFGFNALTLNTTGSSNTASGTNALANNTGGTYNTATGRSTLLSNTNGEDNTGTGANALASNTTGSSNTANGSGALFLNITGANNTATGAGALLANNTGNENTATGVDALSYNTSGMRNTAVGRNALLQSTGNKNIGIGFQAGNTLTIGNNNIYIGNQGAGDENQTIRIGTAQSQTFIAGITSGSVGNASPVVIDTATGQLGIPSSSARYKRDIEGMANRSEGLLKLRPVTFAYRDDTAAAPHYGLIAEEVATVYPELVTRTAAGEVQTVKYHELIPMLLNELQREHREVAMLKRELAELRALAGSRLEK